MRKIAFAILLIGAVGSLCLVLNAGRNAPVLLIILFTGWILTPYVALVFLNFFSKLQTIIAPSMLHWLMLLISVGSLLCYSLTFSQHNGKPATGIFLIVPFISWILIVTTIVISAYKKRKLKI